MSLGYVYIRDTDEYRDNLSNAVSQWWANRPIHKCEHCGYETKQLKTHLKKCKGA